MRRSDLLLVASVLAGSAMAETGEAPRRQPFTPGPPVTLPACTCRAAGQDYRQLAAAVLDGLVERVRSSTAATTETEAPNQTENPPPEPDRAAELAADLFWIDSIT